MFAGLPHFERPIIFSVEYVFQSFLPPRLPLSLPSSGPHPMSTRAILASLRGVRTGVSKADEQLQLRGTAKG